VAPSNGTVDHDKVHAAKVLKIIARLPSATTLLVGDSSDDASAAAACEFSFAAVAFGYGNAAVQTIEPVQYRIATFSDILTLIKPQLIL
jgi:phosphoglycolate phosphatase-like HAD superfamily hydrolase